MGGINKKIKHIFFDLDRTLWDFEENSRLELTAIFEELNLEQKVHVDSSTFIKRYKEINEACWALYRVNKITKEELRSKRFNDALEFYGVSDSALAEKMGDLYVKRSPHRTLLFPNTHETLEYLKEKGYMLHIITNGFSEVQYIKLNESKLSTYFDVIVTSEQVGVKKPDPKIFLFAMEQAQATAEESMYIGDDFEVDVIGGDKVGMTTVLFDPKSTTNTRESFTVIQNLEQLRSLL